MTTPDATPRKLLTFDNGRPRLNVREDVGYILPMAAFLLLVQVGSWWESLAPAAYVARTVVAAGLLYLCWHLYTRIEWTHLGLGILFGILGIIQWVGMEKLLLSQPWLSWTRMSVDMTDLFNPFQHFAESPAWMLYGYIAVRWIGPTFVVPVMEELFWRDFLWRSIIAPNDFKLAKIGEYDRTAFFLIPAIFAAVHVQWLTALVWGLMVAWLLVRTRSIGCVIVMHAVTNFLLGGYVLWTGDWYFW